MKYFFLTVCVAIFAAFVIFSDKNNKDETVKKYKFNPADFNFNPGLDSFTKAEVNRAIHYAHEEYECSEKIFTILRCTDSLIEAIDVVKGKEFFTGVELSKNGDTLFICPMAFNTTKSPHKTLYNVVLDQLIDYKIEGIDKSRKH